MHNKFLPAIIGVLVILGVGGVVLFQKNKKDSDSAVQAQMEEPKSTQEMKLYTMADISTHMSAADCWAVINGSVYNLTAWIPRHPGGERAIIGLCGKDGSSAFNGQHAGGREQEALLATMKIGTIK